MSTLTWYTDTYDNNDNPIHEAASRIGDQEHGPFYYRVKPVLRDMKIQWDNASDSETCTTDLGPWDDLDNAKAELDKADAEWLESLMKEAS